MSNYRIYVEKYPEFQVEARSLLSELNENLQLDLGALRLLNVYDLFGFSEELLEKSRYNVFGEIVTDSVTNECDLSGTKYIAVECLPGQFDQRAASAVDCVRLIDPSAQVNIKSSKLIILPEETSDEDVAKIKKYYINAVRSEFFLCESCKAFKYRNWSHLRLLHLCKFRKVFLTRLHCIDVIFLNLCYILIRSFFWKDDEF